MKTSSDAGQHDVGTNEVSGNVRIELVPRGLIVTIPATRTASSIIIPGLLCAFILYKSAEIIRSLMVDFRGIKASVLPIFLFLIFLWMIFQLLQLLFGHREILRCADNELEITNFDFGYEWRRRSFLRQDVKGNRICRSRIFEVWCDNGLEVQCGGQTDQMPTEFAGARGQ